MLALALVLPVTGGVPSRAASRPPSHWVLAFEDDFDGRAVDGSRWASGFGWGQTVRDGRGACRASHNTVEDGLLHQRITRRSGGERDWVVGCLNTRGRFAQRHGYFEARIQVARCDGAWAAFWAKPADESWPPELDVVEVYGDEPDTARFTVHYANGDGPVTRRRGHYRGPDFASAFHVFAAEWGPEGTTFYVDGVERFRATAGRQAMSGAGPFYVTVNTQVHRPSADCHGATQLVDWVRVWRRA